jgi:hypothetical protein
LREAKSLKLELLAIIVMSKGLQLDSGWERQSKTEGKPKAH